MAAASVVWRTGPDLLTSEQAAAALGLTVTAFERKIETGELMLKGHPAPGGRTLYLRDAVRQIILAGSP